jgi:CheY-like chemotaxis protein
LTVEEVIRHPEKPKEVPAVAGNGTALVIEDEPQVRQLAASVIARLGFTVLEAGDGVEGVEIFKAHQGEIRCVICDLSMPIMDGWETLSALRKLSPGIPVILASGHDKASVMTGDHPEWPQAFLSKPYGLQDLREAIGRAIPGQAENRAEVEGPDVQGSRFFPCI